MTMKSCDTHGLALFFMGHLGQRFMCKGSYAEVTKRMMNA